MIALLLMLLPVVVTSQSCESIPVAMAIQKCTPMYLADIWQSKNKLHIAQSHTISLSKENVCKYTREMATCVDNIFGNCPELSSNKENITMATAPLLNGLRTMCLARTSSFCTTDNFLTALNLMPVSATSVSEIELGRVCPLVRIADNLLGSAYGKCDTSTEIKNLLYIAIESRGAVGEPFFKCQDGISSDATFLKPLKVCVGNETCYTPEVLFHCESQLLNSTRCVVQQLVHVDGERTKYQLSANTAFGINDRECKHNEYYSFSSFSCQKCPTGYDKKAPSLTANYFCNVCPECTEPGNGNNPGSPQVTVASPLALIVATLILILM